MGTNYASKVIKVAEAEVGYLEKASNSNLDSKTGNAGSKNYTKYARDFDSKYPDFYNGKKNGYAWCDIFVDWCFVTAFGVEAALKLLGQPKKSCGAGCSWSALYYQRIPSFYRSPKVGDQIFFRDKNGSPCHTGLVYKVDSTYVYTIEGNTSTTAGVVANGGCVAKKKYKLDSSSIHGYGRPKYDAEPVAATKSIETIAKEVIAGKWGNGTARIEALKKAGYDAAKVQAKVNELCKPQKKAYTGTFPVLPSRGYFQKCDNGTQVKNLQKFLNWYGGYKLDVDGCFGNKTLAAVKDFQKQNKLTVDGKFGKNSLAKAKTIKK